MKERETEEEIEVVTDSEMEQQTGDKEETEIITDKEKEIVEEDAQGDPNQTTWKSEENQIGKK